MPKPWLSNVLLFLKGNLVQNPKINEMNRTPQRTSRTSPLNPWRRMVVKLNYLLQMAFTQCSAQLMVREMKHGAPALTSYAVAMAKTEVHQIRKETSSMVLTPGTTARAKTTRILHQGYPVPTDLCLHEAEHARKIGNKHGRFLECTACGLVKKALETDYGVPITKERIPIYRLQHGIRSHPGGKVAAVMRSTQAYSANLAMCYSLSLPSSSAQASRTSARRTLGTTSTRSMGETWKAPHSSRDSQTWEEVGMDDTMEDA